MGVRSEYQKQFKVSTLEKYLSIYYENVAFRTARRDREYSHTPLSWCDDDDVDTASIDSDEEEGKLSCRDSVAVEKGKLCCRDVEENRKEISTATVTLSNKMSVPQTVSTEKSTDEEGTCDEETKESDSNGNNHNSDYNQDDVSLQLKLQDKKRTAPTKVVRSSRERRPDRKQKIPRASKKKQAPSRTPTPQSSVGHPAPFMSYGWAHTDLGPSYHKTYNVRSTAEVHPDALRAHSRRKTAVKERAVSVQRSREDRVKAMLEKACGGPAPEEGDWQSEYQLQYPAYDTREYIRSLSARSLDVNEKKLRRVVYVS